MPWVTVFLDFPADGFDRSVEFWRQVTGYGLSPSRGADGEFATLLPVSGDAYLRVQRVRGGPGGHHLDLHVDTAAESLEDAADRARSAGAQVTSVDEGLVVARSPGGFTFCLVAWHGERAVPPSLAGERDSAGQHSASQPGASRLDTLCLDVPPGGFDRELAFWAALTGQRTRPAPVPGYAYLDGPAAWPVRLLLQRREQAGHGDQVRGHVDFGCTDPSARDRHVALGARVAATRQYWTVLTDPAGREYCLVGRDPR
jgi:hypothetical protein